MAIHKITIPEFIELAKTMPVLDVRSPGEYNHAHIPGAYSLPLFSDEERKVVGTAYKQQSRQTAIKIGLDYFGVKMKAMVEEVEKLIADRTALTGKEKQTVNSQPQGTSLLVHCWRGGMRSAGVAWLLDLYGFKAYTLAGGYKAYRKWVNEQFAKSYRLKVLGGFTGSGKTLVLREMHRSGLPIIDLEALANHKGSAFGALGEQAQKTQEMFENLLAEALAINSNAVNNSQPTAIPNHSIWIEDESQRIGNLNIPPGLWDQMRKSEIIFLDIPFEERLCFLIKQYGQFGKDDLVNSITRIQKRLGGLETKNALNFLAENDHAACFRILLKYYDKWYNKGLQNREIPGELLNKVSYAKVDANAITDLLIREVSKTKPMVKITAQSK